MLALHPDHQEKVFQEILTVMSDKNSDLTLEDLEKLEFTELCIRESLRLYPTAPLIGRVANKPIKLKNNIDIPANVPLIFGLRQIHMQEKYYGKTANAFDPYRFLDEKVKNLPPTTYIPFSYGPRNCGKFKVFHTLISMFQLSAFFQLAIIMQKFRWNALSSI